MTLLITLVSLVLPLLFGSLCYSALHGRFYEMDYSREGSFLVCYALFRRIYWVIFSIGLVGATFYAGRSYYPAIGLIFLASSIYALLFNGWMAYCYEAYLRSKFSRTPPPIMWKQPEGAPPVPDPAITGNYGGFSNYSGLKYSITLALAFSSLLLFLASLCLGTVALIER